MRIPEFEEIIVPNDQTAARAEHLEKLRELVGNVYPNKFDRSTLSGGEDTLTAIKNWDPVVAAEAEMAAIKANLSPGERPPAELKDAMNERLKGLGTVRIAGRSTTPPRGNFVHLTDGISKLQIYCNKKGPLALIRNDADNSVDEENGWVMWQLVDHGDLIGAEGYLFVTNTGEVSVHVEKLQFLAKAMLPMPDKMHGIADPELQRRYRYADLIASSLQVRTDEEAVELTTREVFERRAKLVSNLRRFLDDHGYIEVETPMLTPKATGAAAKPFETHHNALDIPLYARIAPELYLKRLVVGGFEKVYELNRNFRNEGLSQRHNPEFTMLEFYAAYMDVNGMMDFAETMIKEAVAKANGGGLVVMYGENEIDFSSFERISMKSLVANHFPAGISSSLFDPSHGEEVTRSVLAALAELSRQFEFAKNSVLMVHESKDSVVTYGEANIKKYLDDGYVTYQQGSELLYSWDKKLEKFQSMGEELPSIEKSIIEIFENTVEEQLLQPTFIVDYPKSISPLSKASPDDTSVAERFELFINGMEVANGFSELNDPKEQYDRFVDQMSQREGGDEEAMVLDEDYIRALSYGMPPAAGIGIGIDRLVMLLTDKHSIRDVILFPHMRPETKVTGSDQ